MVPIQFLFAHFLIKHSCGKDCRINLRVSKRDVEALKTKALEEGIPCQTLVTSILHKYVSGKAIRFDHGSAWDPCEDEQLP